MYYIEIVAVVLPLLSHVEKSLVTWQYQYSLSFVRGLATIPGLDFHAGLQM